MKSINKWLLHGIALMSILGMFLVNHVMEQEKHHKQEIYELRTELRETKFQLDMATMHIELMNKERESD